MSKSNNPRVELLARPILDPEAVQRFLDGQNIDWPDFKKHLDSEMDLGDRDGEWLGKLIHNTCQKPSTDHPNFAVEHIFLNFVIWDISNNLRNSLVSLFRHIYKNTPVSCIFDDSDDRVIFLSISVYNIRHFLSELIFSSDIEMRVFIIEIFKVIYKALPCLFNNMRIINLADGAQSLEIDEF
jgi:hypothetical protein